MDDDPLDIRFTPLPNSSSPTYQRRTYYMVLIGFIVFLGVCALHVLQLLGYVTVGKTPEVHVHLPIDNDAGTLVHGHIDPVAALLADSNLIVLHKDHPPLLHAGHSTSKEANQIYDRGQHHDFMHFLNDDAEELGPRNEILGYYGIDVSHWQNKIEWDKIKTDTVPHPISFSIMKATQGSGIVDHYFSRNWQKALSDSVIVGAYHFYVYHDDPLEQAENYINTVNINKGNFRPILDVELNCTDCTAPQISREKLVADISTYLKALEDHYKVKPIIYTYTSFFEEYLKNDFGDYLFWISRFSNLPPADMALYEHQEPVPPEIAMWQFTSGAKVKGVVGNVDMSFLPHHYVDTLVVK